MAIISYTPAKKEVKDFRKTGHGYYTATCDRCKAKFWPNRRTAKYCSANCCAVHKREIKAFQKELDAMDEEE